MKKKLMIFIGLVFVFIFNLSLLSQAEESEKNIIYLYSTTNQLSESVKNELEAKGININSIDVTKLDNMKYFHLYNAAYEISEEHQELPIVLSGNAYYSGNNEIESSLLDIEQKASNSIKDIRDVNIKMIVYFYATSCTGCQEIKPKIKELEKNKGIKVVRVDVSVEENFQLRYSYGHTYYVPSNKLTTPLIFAGDKYYHSAKTITSNLDEIELNSSKPLKDVELIDIDLSKYEGFIGLLLILVAGLVDGVNPCAIAMLILFISLLVGLSSKKRTLISVSIAYILGLFVTYFALGAFLIQFLGKIGPYIQNLTLYINIFIIALSLFLFLFNLHDYFVSKNEEYGKVKNQLPKGIQKFNKKLIKIFTNSIENKNIIIVYIISFGLAVIISLTEFLCTGQVYLPTLLIIAHSGGISGMLKLFLYNVMFVLPLIVIAVMAIKSQSAMATSNKIREKMYLIKLITSILFLVIAIYYIFKVLGVM